MNRVERELHSHNGVLNGRHWTSCRRTDARGFEVSELHDGCYFPCHWTGKSLNAAAFKLLDTAAGYRFSAKALPRYDLNRRPIFLHRAREAIADSRKRSAEEAERQCPDCTSTLAQASLRCPHNLDDDCPLVTTVPGDAESVFEGML